MDRLTGSAGSETETPTADVLRLADTSRWNGILGARVGVLTGIERGRKGVVRRLTSGYAWINFDGTPEWEWVPVKLNRIFRRTQDE